MKCQKKGKGSITSVFHFLMSSIKLTLVEHKDNNLQERAYKFSFLNNYETV